jgi:hypothetical protein
MLFRARVLAQASEEMIHKYLCFFFWSEDVTYILKVHQDEARRGIDCLPWKRICFCFASKAANTFIQLA